MGYKNIAILHDNTTYAQGLAEATKTSLEALGVTPVFYDAINPDDTDFSPTLTKLKELNPEVIYFTGYYAQGGLLLKQAKALGMTSAWTGGNAMNNTDLIKIAGVENAKGFITTTEPLPNDLPYPEAKTIPCRLQGQVQRRSDQRVGTVLAGGRLPRHQNAIEQTKSTDPKKLAEYLHKDFKALPGISGPILGFDAEGRPQRHDPQGVRHQRPGRVCAVPEVTATEQTGQRCGGACGASGPPLLCSSIPSIPLPLAPTARPTWNYSPRTSSTA